MFCIIEYNFDTPNPTRKYTQICFGGQANTIVAISPVHSYFTSRDITISADYSTISFSIGYSWAYLNEDETYPNERGNYAIPTAIYFVYGGATKLS